MSLMCTIPPSVRDLAAEAKAKGFAVAVKRGLFQVQIVKYRASGTSVIKPLTPFVSLDEAVNFVREQP